MPAYRRWRGGSMVFLALVTADRWGLFASSAARALLRDAIARTMAERPWEMVGIVLLPDHLHNPVKHGWAARPWDWAWSSFHRYVKIGWYESHWCGRCDLAGSVEYLWHE